MRFNSIFDPSLWAVARSWSGAIFSIIVVSVESGGWMRSAAAMCDRVVSMNAPRLVMAVFSSAHFEAREGSCANVKDDFRCLERHDICFELLEGLATLKLDVHRA